MRLTIIVSDGAVYKNGSSYSELDLSFMPSDVRAFQWYETYGEIEYKRQIVDGKSVHPENELVTSLPNWVNQCLVKWDEAEASRLAAEEQARLAAEEAARLANASPQQT